MPFCAPKIPPSGTVSCVCAEHSLQRPQAFWEPGFISLHTYCHILHITLGAQTWLNEELKKNYLNFPFPGQYFTHNTFLF